MKTRKTKKHARLFLRLRTYGSYVDEAYYLERMLAKKPACLMIEMMGAGEIPPDMVLLMRSMILNRSAKTRLVIHARSSLRGGAVLIWLLGDTRLIREDARMFLRSAGPFSPHDMSTRWKDADGLEGDELENDDYLRVLHFIDEFLPVKELVDQPIARPVLKQFGLVDSKQMDQFLAQAFRKKEPTSKRPITNRKRTVKQTGR